jgi:hypothetical protein
MAVFISGHTYPRSMIAHLKENVNKNLDITGIL